MSRSGTKSSKAGYEERKITQLKELKALLWGLDLDEGIRFVANVEGYPEPCFVFVTKCDDKICVTAKERVFDKALNHYVPGGKEQWKYFESAETAWQYIEKLLNPPIEAFYY